jgi:nuclease S1
VNRNYFSPVLALMLVLVLVRPSVCLAWGGEGHQLCALIAERNLTPAARAMVKELLGDANISDAEVVSWADEIKRDERRDTADWHYVNIPHDAKGFDRRRDGRRGENVIDKLTEQARVLADKTQPKDKRAEALRWVVYSRRLKITFEARRVLGGSG